MKHIAEDQWSDWVSGNTENQSEIDSHLHSCEICRTEGERFRSLLAEFSGAAHQEATREESFWTTQRADILRRADSGNRPFTWRWAIPIPAAALVLVLTIMVMRSSAPKTPPVQSNDARDEALLLQIQNDSYRQVPAALAPAGLIVEERNRVLSSKKSQNR
jgi:anti-sigma factor RsiW